MADNPLSQNLPADLPENWVNAQIIPANGASIGMSAQHGYNYLMQQGNASQNAINTIGAAFSGVFGKNETIPIANGGTGATSVANARTNLSVYSKSEVNNLLSPMNVSITSLGSTKLNTIGKGVNLLDNWYFIGGGSQQGGGQFPINQRGNTSYTGNVYGFDRWNCGATVTLRPDCVRVENNSNFWFFQIPTKTPKDFVGLTLTASCLAKANVTGNLRMMFSDDETPGTWGDSGWTEEVFQQGETRLLTFTRKVTKGCACFILQPTTTNASFDVYAVKLELGDAQTLARQENGQWVLNDPPPNYALELAKCNMSLATPNDSYSNFPFPHIANGSYVGAGTYGSSNPNSLTFSFVPKIIWCARTAEKFAADDNSSIKVLYTPLLSTEYQKYAGFCESAKTDTFGRKSSNGKTIEWYSTSTTNQLNISGTTYYYIAIG